MGTAPENQAAYVHQTSLVCVTRRGEPMRLPLPRARSLANFKFAVDDARRNVGDDTTRCRTAGLLILKNCEIARAPASTRACACHRHTTREMKETKS
jgi:hypothetical protein